MRGLDGLGNADKLALAGSPYPSVAELLARLPRRGRAATPSTPDQRCATRRRTTRCVAARRRDPPARVRACSADVIRVLDGWRRADKALRGRAEMATLPALTDMRAQLGRLVHRGFVAEAGPARLRRYPTYLAALRHRRERLDERHVGRRDRLLMDQVAEPPGGLPAPASRRCPTAGRRGSRCGGCGGCWRSTGSRCGPSSSAPTARSATSGSARCWPLRLAGASDWTQVSGPHRTTAARARRRLLRRVSPAARPGPGERGRRPGGARCWCAGRARQRRRRRRRPAAAPRRHRGHRDHRGGVVRLAGRLARRLPVAALPAALVGARRPVARGAASTRPGRARAQVARVVAGRGRAARSRRAARRWSTRCCAASPPATSPTCCSGPRPSRGSSATGPGRAAPRAPTPRSRRMLALAEQLEAAAHAELAGRLA